MDTASAPLLSVRGLRTVYRLGDSTVTAVEGANLSLQGGETLALVGESGSGKTAIGLSIMGLLPRNGEIQAGEILFDGRDLVSMKAADRDQTRGRKLAMVFQNPVSSLNPVLRIGRQLEAVTQYHLRLSKREARSRAIEGMRAVGISEPERRLRQFPHELSGGISQRVMIAMAISCGPGLLIADEPTTALDVTIQAQIVDLMKRLSKDLGMAVLWITHDMGVVASIADRVAVMYAGRIVETGRVDDVYARPRHPYTAGLIAAIPNMRDSSHERLRSIEGAPPDPTGARTGCLFAPRCPLAIARCWAETPPLLPTDAPMHESACWRSSDVQSLAH